MPLTCQDLKQCGLLPGLWTKATSLEHPFLRGCREGTIGAHAFNVWLVQVCVLLFARRLSDLA